MAVPSQPTYSVAALVAAHTALRDLIDSHATLPGVLRIRDVSDVLLAEIPLADPCGTVTGATGQLVLDVDPVPRDDSAAAGGTAAYAELCDGAGAVHLTIPCQEGDTPVAGKVVLQSLTIVAGAPIELVSLTVG